MSGPVNYRFFAPGPEKTLDGLAMLYRVGVRPVDMEMLQFHPAGLIVPGSVVAGSLLEGNLRGAGAHLLNVDGRRFMRTYDPKKITRFGPFPVESDLEGRRLFEQANAEVNRSFLPLYGGPPQPALKRLRRNLLARRRDPLTRRSVQRSFRVRGAACCSAIWPPWRASCPRRSGRGRPHRRSSRPGGPGA